MESTFTDSGDIWGIDASSPYAPYWQASPWRNYYRLPKKTEVFFTNTTGQSCYFYCADEEYEGMRLRIDLTNDSGSTGIDALSRFRLYKGGVAISDLQGTALTTVTSGKTGASGLGNASLSLGHNFNSHIPKASYGQSWIGPGLGVSWGNNLPHATTTFTGDDDISWTITKDSFNPRRYDGGLHSWIKMCSGVNAGVVNNRIYTKALPGNILNSRDFMFIFNSFGGKYLLSEAFATLASNRALSIGIEGSEDGDKWGDLMGTDNAIAGDIDPLNSTLYGNRYILTQIIRGEFKYRPRYVRFYISVEDGPSNEELFKPQSFAHISLYAI